MPTGFQRPSIGAAATGTPSNAAPVLGSRPLKPYLKPLSKTLKRTRQAASHKKARLPLC
jgi:hypothetical protein